MDCGFENKDGWFRYRAAAIIIENNCVLMAKNEIEPYYYSVGGAVLLHETAENAVIREVLEETGIKYKIERLAFIHENFFKGLGNNKNLRCHEVAFYYLMKPKGSQKLNSNSYTQGVKENMHWLPINRLNEYFIYPTFFIDKLLNMRNYVEHIISKEY